MVRGMAIPNIYTSKALIQVEEAVVAGKAEVQDLAGTEARQAARVLVSFWWIRLIRTLSTTRLLRMAGETAQRGAMDSQVEKEAPRVFLA